MEIDGHPSGLHDREVSGFMAISKAARSRAAKKAWRTRRKRYGKDGVRGTRRKRR